MQHFTKETLNVSRNRIAVFTKPWKRDPEELGKIMRGFGVDSIELPVRDGYPVNPQNALSELPRAVETLQAHGIGVESIAAPITEDTIRACGKAKVPIIRVCEGIDMAIGYRASVDKIKRQYESFFPVLEACGVKIGLQNHCGFSVGSALGIMDAIGEYDPRLVGAVLDVAHCALDGEPEEMAIDIVWSHLCMVNLKNARRVRTNGPEVDEATWRIEWTTAPNGFASWRKTVEALDKRGYRGPYCLSAEYSNPAGRGDLTAQDPEQEKALEERLRVDVAHIKSILGR